MATSQAPSTPSVSSLLMLPLFPPDIARSPPCIEEAGSGREASGGGLHHAEEEGEAGIPEALWRETNERHEEGQG